MAYVRKIPKLHGYEPESSGTSAISKTPLHRTLCNREGVLNHSEIRGTHLIWTREDRPQRGYLMLTDDKSKITCRYCCRVVIGLRVIKPAKGERYVYPRHLRNLPPHRRARRDRRRYK